MKGKFLFVTITLIVVCGISSLLIQNAAYAKILSGITAISLVSLTAFGTIELANVANTEISEIESGTKKTWAYVLLNAVGSFAGMISVGMPVLYLIATYQGVSMRHLYLNDKFYSFLPLAVGTVFYFSARYFSKGKTLVKKGAHTVGNSRIPMKLIGLLMLASPFTCYYINQSPVFTVNESVVVYKVAPGVDTIKVLTYNDMISSLFVKNNLTEDVFIQGIVGRISQGSGELFMTPYGLSLKGSGYGSVFSIAPSDTWFVLIIELLVSLFILFVAYTILKSNFSLNNTWDWLTSRRQ